MEILSVLGTFTKYCGETAYGIIFLLCILLIYKDSSAKVRKYLWGIGICLVLFCFNDFSRLILAKVGGGETYYRFFWMLPIIPTISYVLIKNIETLKNNKEKLIIFVLGILVLMMAGTNFYKTNGFKLPENAYKLPQNMICIIEHIKEDSSTKEPLVLGDLMSECYIRQYDASIMLSIGRDKYIGKKKKTKDEQLLIDVVENRNTAIDKEEFKDLLTKYKIEYIVLINPNNINEYLISVGLEVSDTHGEYSVYKVR